jgi:hypothetical protein
MDGNDETLLILLNDFIIDIIYKHKYFNENEYNSIKKINNKSKIRKSIDCPTNIQMKKDTQHYTFYFLLEYIKHITSILHKKNSFDINEDEDDDEDNNEEDNNDKDTYNF